MKRGDFTLGLLFLLLIFACTIRLGGDHNHLASQLEQIQLQISDMGDGIIAVADLCSGFLTGKVEELKYEELPLDKSCVGLKNISISEEQSERFLECIKQDRGYCYCVEMYATCELSPTGIADSIKYEFNPDCAKK